MSIVPTIDVTLHCILLIAGADEAIVDDVARIVEFLPLRGFVD
jgi:hypothetical protein